MILKCKAQSLNLLLFIMTANHASDCILSLPRSHFSYFSQPTSFSFSFIPPLQCHFLCMACWTLPSGLVPVGMCPHSLCFPFHYYMALLMTYLVSVFSQSTGTEFVFLVTMSLISRLVPEHSQHLGGRGGNTCCNYLCVYTNHLYVQSFSHG